MSSRRLSRDVCRHVLRAVRWQAVVVGGVLALAVGRGTTSAPVALLGTLVAAGSCFVFDDPAARTLASSPTSLWRRRLLAMGLVLPLTAVVWTAVVYPFAHGSARRLPPLEANLEAATLVAVVLAMAGFAARRSEDGVGSVTAAPALLAFVLVVGMLPDSWAFYPVGAHQGRWPVLLVFASLGIPAASRDLAHRLALTLAVVRRPYLASLGGRSERR
jgi:hypothetical protein